MKTFLTVLTLCVILGLAALLRIQGLNWDETQHLHPDERFMTMVASAIEWPSSWASFLDTAKSPLCLYNRGFNFFSYGTAPLFVTKALALLFNRNGYDQIHMVGRAVSTACDLFTILLIFLLGRRLFGRGAALLAAFLYAVCVLGIQFSHFFTVDSMACLIATATVYFACRTAQDGRARDFLLMGLCIGLSMATKLSLLTLIVLACAVTFLRLTYPFKDRADLTTGAKTLSVLKTLLGFTACLGLALLAFRIGQPYAFQGPGLISDFNPKWLANMKEIASLTDGTIDFPPGHQWAGRARLWFPWLNLITVGTGPFLGLAAWGGWLAAAWLFLTGHDRRPDRFIAWLWVPLLFVHLASQFTCSLRYLLPIYPVLTLFAAHGLLGLWQKASALPSGARRILCRASAMALALGVCAGTAAWARAFCSIYQQPHSRIEASRWMIANLPRGSLILNEHWDDALPLRVDGKDPFSTHFKGELLPWYDTDSPAKLERVLALLDRGEVIVLSSNRLYDSIPRLPRRYPMTLNYYQALFDGSLGFKKTAEFTAYPRLLGVEIPDQGQEEAFSVYDHPRVQVFRKTPDWSLHKARALLTRNVDWSAIQPVQARDVGQWKNELKQNPDILKEQRRLGSVPLTEAAAQAHASMPDRHRPWVCIVLWILVIEWLGLIALPLCITTFTALDDRGWLLARGLGLLGGAYVCWLLAALKAVPFTPTGALLLLALLSVLALAYAWRRRQDIFPFIDRQSGLLLLEDLVFWSVFALFLFIRSGNPDLWHPYMGGEKPMDFAYLNAMIRSEWFPPSNPWLSGMIINYYYFGFMLVALLSKVTGVAPAIAYNLAIPTFAALTAGAAFTGTRALARLLQRNNNVLSAGRLFVAGLLGVIFVTCIGNLTEIKLLFQSGPLRNEWWYWNASRPIPHPPSEVVPIAEFPFFTFLYGDLHAHMMALPFTLILLCLALNALRLLRTASPPADTAAPRHRVFQALGSLPGCVTLGLMALVSGALFPTNAWDYPTWLSVSALALFLGLWAAPAPSVTATMRFLLAIGSIIVLGRALFQPFFAAFSSAYGDIEPWKGSRTPLGAYLLVHGFFLFVLVGWVFTWAQRELRRAKLTLWQAVRSGFGRQPAAWVMPLSAVAQPPESGPGLGKATAATLDSSASTLSPILLPATPTPTPNANTHLPPERVLFFFGLILAALALTLFAEFFVLKGDTGRMNTVFKFYFQVWALWGTAAAACAVHWLWPDAAETRRWTPARITALTIFSLLLSASLLYPFLATPARWRDRFENVKGFGIDGEAFMATARHSAKNQRFELKGDLGAIRWLLSHVQGAPVILEGQDDEYQWGSRISVHTGLPSVIGWRWHQVQQRMLFPAETVDRRIRDVRLAYSEAAPDRILPVLKQYDVRYIIVGPLERALYPGPGFAKFEAPSPYWDTVYNQDQVRILRVKD